MKNSGIEWIGEIPDDWEVVYLSSIFEEHKRKNTGLICNNLLSLSYGKIKRKDINTNDGLLPGSFEGYNIIDKGDIVLRLTDLQNDQKSLRTGIAREAGIVTSAYVTIRCIPKIAFPEYMHYYLHSFDTAKGFYGMGDGVRQGLNYDGIKKIKILLPSVVVQQKIVDYLDKKYAAIDRLIENQQKQIEKLKEYKQSVITEAVTKGLDSSVLMKDSANKYYPQLPILWNLQKVLSILAMPITDGPHTTPELFDEGIAFVSAEAVSCGNGNIDFTHIRGYISNEFYNECCKKYIPQLDDIYMIKSGATTGKVSIVSTLIPKFTIWSPLAVLRIDKKKGCAKYLFYALQTINFQKQIALNWSYGTQQNLGMRTLEQLILPVPSLEEQQQIADYLDKKCAKIDKLVSIKEQKIDKLNEYKKSLIYEYITGKKEVG